MLAGRTRVLILQIQCIPGRIFSLLTAIKIFLTKNTVLKSSKFIIANTVFYKNVLVVLVSKFTLIFCITIWKQVEVNLITIKYQAHTQFFCRGGKHTYSYNLVYIYYTHIHFLKCMYLGKHFMQKRNIKSNNWTTFFCIGSLTMSESHYATMHNTLIILWHGSFSFGLRRSSNRLGNIDSSHCGDELWHSQHCLQNFRRQSSCPNFPSGTDHVDPLGLCEWSCNLGRDLW